MRGLKRGWSWFSQFWIALVLSASLGSIAHAQALKVLILATSETQADGVSTLNALENDFKNPTTNIAVTGTPSIATSVTRLNTLSTPGAITSNTFIATDNKPYDVVVIASVYNLVDNANWIAIKQAAEERKSNSFIMFLDSCCANGATLLRNWIQSSTGPLGSLGSSIGITGTDGAIASPLNSTSAYFDSFKHHQTLYGGAAYYLTNVPANNRLYVREADHSQTYGILIPSGDSFGGKGACLFGVVDVTPFDDYSSAYNPNRYGSNISSPTAGNDDSTAQAFLKAASAGGACGVPSINKKFADIAVAPGQTTILTITLTNSSLNKAGNVAVQDTLPAPLLVSSLDSNTCGGTLNALAGSNSLSLNGGEVSGATLGVGSLTPSTCEIKVSVMWPKDLSGFQSCTAAAGTPVVNTIQPGPAGDPTSQFSTGIGQVTIPTIASLVCIPPDLKLEKTVDAVQATEGQVLNYKLTITNASKLPANNVVVNDVLPAGLSLVAVGAPCSAGFPCTLSNLGAQSDISIDLQAKVSAGYLQAHGAVILNTANATSDSLPAGTELTASATSSLQSAKVTVLYSIDKGDATNAVASAINGVVPSSLACGNAGNFSQNATIASGLIGSTAHTVPVGASCAVQVGALPSLPSGYIWGEPLIGSFSNPITAGTNPSVTVQWRIQRQPPVNAFPVPVPGLGWPALAWLFVMIFGCAIHAGVRTIHRH